MALITRTQVVDIAFTNKNTDKYLVKPAFVEIAELNFVQPNLGSDLYDDILDDKANNVVWSSVPVMFDDITCGPDPLSSLQNKYIKMFTANDASTIAVYFEYLTAPVPAIMATPPGYTNVCKVDLSLTPTPSAADVCDALETAINGSGFGLGNAVSDGVNKVTLSRPGNAHAPYNHFTMMSSFLQYTSYSNFTVVSGSPIVTCSANSFISVGDFVSGNNIPLREDGTGSCRAFNTVLTVDTPGAVTSFTISGTPQSSNAFSSILFQKPNGKLVDDYIRNYLAFCVRFEMIPDMAYNTTSQGLVESTSSFSLPVDAKTLGFMRTETYKKSDTYLRKMKEFLLDNPLSYPLYCNDTEGKVSKLNGIILY
tara:strand:+ start:174 stop:1274 length:1101 start_codon:yes stop_codon:yes gene_type:complete